eukprot:jgi/Psemu1/8818/gm1.8818_g
MLTGFQQVAVEGTIGERRENPPTASLLSCGDPDAWREMYNQQRTDDRDSRMPCSMLLADSNDDDDDDDISLSFLSVTRLAEKSTQSEGQDPTAAPPQSNARQAWQSDTTEDQGRAGSRVVTHSFHARWCQPDDPQPCKTEPRSKAMIRDPEVTSYNGTKTTQVHSYRILGLQESAHKVAAMEKVPLGSTSGICCSRKGRGSTQIDNHQLAVSTYPQEPLEMDRVPQKQYYLASKVNKEDQVTFKADPKGVREVSTEAEGGLSMRSAG